MGNISGAGGTTTSFSNTPQAKDDTYTYLEDVLRQNTTLYNSATNTLILDVMSNDLGGAAKSLFSVEDGDGNPLTADFSLIEKDVNASGVSPWEETFCHNWMRINNGKVEFRIADGSGIPGQGRSIDSLTAGEHFSDQFVYAIKLGNGTLSEATVKINITGANDVASISDAPLTDDHSVTEAGGVANGDAGDAVAGGQLTVHDVDAGEAHFQVPGSLAGQYGTFTFDATSGVWGYTLANDADAVQQLNAGDVVHDTLEVTSLDGTATTTIDVTITGSNDAATITASASEDTQVVEAGGVANGDAGDAVAGGQLTVHDVDAGEAHFQVPGSLAGQYGTFTFDATSGVWGYTLANDADAVQQLNAGDVVHDTLEVTSLDGTATTTIDVTITGSNDAATITASASEDTQVVEAGGVANGDAGDAVAGGQLTVHDVDAGEAHFQVPGSLAGQYGTFTFDATSGVWGYTLANDADAVQQLNAGDVVHDTLEVTSLDGTATTTIDVTITGSNDAATITASASEDTQVVEAGGVANGDAGDAVAGGQLTVHDVDAGEAHFQVPGSLAGQYGTFTFDATSGVWGYTLANDADAVQQLNAGDVVHDTLEVTSLDGTATTTIDVTITGSNDAATITASASEDTQVVEAGGVANGDAGDAVAGGQLTVHDVDAGEAHFQVPGSLAGQYGTFTFDATSGVWGYTLANDADAVQQLNAGDVVHDTLEVTSLDGTATTTIDVTITGSNDAATITASASEDTQVVEAGGVANGDAGDAVAGGQLTVHDVDAGEAHFQVPGSLAGQYGTFTFDATSGVWGYTLANDADAVQQLNAGDVVHDTLEVTSLDGTATTTIDVTITGSNDAATITGATSGSVTEDAVPNTASGDLNSTDVDNANDSWNVVSSPHATANSYGTYTIDATGHWTYTLDNTNAAVNGLNTGATLTDTFTVTTVDGTSQLVSVTINGHTDVAPRVAPTDVQLTPQTPPDSVNFNSFTFSGTLTATDPDPGAFTFTILSQTGLGNFAINGNTLTSEDISQNKTYGVTVHTVQTGDPAGLFWDETFTIITGGNGNNNDTLNGVSGDDVLYGNTGNDMLFGLAGNDTLFGQDGADRLTGGSGNDTLWGGGGNDVFVLDSVAAGDVDTIADYGSGDTIDIRAVLSVSSGTNVLTGGYLRVTTTGLIQIDANGSATGGQVWTTIGHVNTGAGPYAITYLAGGVATTVNVNAVAPPIALDLDGDGKVSFVGTEAGAAFDYGYGKVGTAWVAGNDGILVRDGNHDGQVSANEMVFSTGGSDLEGLAVYDSNHDGQLNSADAAFADFAVWQDANGDGQVDAGELHSLADEKIAGISLSSDRHSYVAADGDVTVVGTGSFTRTDGSTGVLADSVFATVDQGAAPAAHGAWSMMASMADYIANSDDMQALMAHVGADAARSSIPDASAEAHAMLVEAIDQPGIEDLVAAFIESGGKENGGLAHVTSEAGPANPSLHQQASPVSGVPEQSEIGSHDLSGFGLTGVGHNDFAMQLALAQHP